MRCIYSVNVAIAYLILLFSPEIVSAQDSFWEQADGPYGGSVRSLAIDADGDIFAGTEGGGVFISNDNGTNWTRSFVQRMNNKTPFFTDISALAVGPDKRVYAATLGGGVYNTSNGGAKWSGGLPSFSWVSSLAVAANGDVFAGITGGQTASGVYRSTNGGFTWSLAGLRTYAVVALAIKSDGTIFAGKPGGCYRSTDNGNTWGSTSMPYIDVHAITIDANGVVYAGTDEGVYRSTNDGAIWTQSSNGIPEGGVSSIVAGPNNLIFAGTSAFGIYRSSNQGDEWVPMNNGITSRNIQSVVINSYGDVFTGTSGAGIFRSSTQGSEWECVNHGLAATRVQALSVHTDGRIYAGTRGGGVHRSRDNGNTWESTSLDSVDVRAIHISPAGNFFAGSDGGTVYYSMDNSDSWISLPIELTDKPVNCLTGNSSGMIFAGTNGDGVFCSTDLGRSWAEANNGLTNKYIRSFVVADNGHIFAGSAQGTFRSTDEGSSWSIRPSMYTFDVHCLTKGPSGHLFAGGYDVYRSSDDGSEWARTNFPVGPVNAIMAGSNQTIIANGGTRPSPRSYISMDNTKTWEDIDFGYPMYAFALEEGGRVIAGTDGSGVFRSVQSTTSVQLESTGTPQAFALGQNYPNPFNPTTTIQYTLQKPERVSLCVTDLYGREVQRLLNSTFEQVGSHQVQFDAAGLPSGVYFYSLIAGEVRQTRKMLVVR